MSSDFSNTTQSLPMEGKPISTGHTGMDALIDSLRLGDNVVWHVDALDDYREFAQAFAERALHDGQRVIYVRFGKHEPILPEDWEAVEVFRLEPREGFERCTAAISLQATRNGREVFYVFDSLTELVRPWATGELVANFFQTVCPQLYRLDTIAYFALERGYHSNQTLARVYNTTQVFIELFRHRNERFLKMIKIWDRYSNKMFFTHRLEGDRLDPVFEEMTKRKSGVTKTGEIRPESPWESLQLRLDHVEEVGVDAVPPEDVAALRHEFSRLLIGRHPVFSVLADRYLRIDSLLSIRRRLIGSGRIGGKSVGMLLAREILKDKREGLSDPSVLEEHDSFYLGSDVFYTFLVRNELFRLRLERTRGGRQEELPFETVEQRFVEGTFPPAIVDELRKMLEYFGEHPIIVRSSSLLEDSFGGAFAGKYRSEFCPNQGPLEDRLRELTDAIKLVYASSLSDDAISYRRRRKLENREELMAVLIQRVAGIRYRDYFFPTLAGVAFSRNLFAWNDRIDPRKGIVRLVFGLGTRAVDRVGGDYPRMIAVSHPFLRPEVGVEVAKYSQHEMDLIDLKENQFRSVPVGDILSGGSYPNLHLLISTRQADYVEDPFTRFLDPKAEYVLTFNNLLRQTPLIRLLGESLAALENAYGHPVDIEFTAGIEPGGRISLNLLQCRPLWDTGTEEHVHLPENIADENVLFAADRVITGGTVDDIRFILYIDPAAYDAIDYPPDRKTLGRVIGRLNNHPDIAPHPFILIGPGRWGSGNVDLGVNVSYADIENTNVLIELSTESDEHSPEVSYGTHFFQDLVEEEIIYLPVFTENPVSRFKHDFFLESPNCLSDFLPEYDTMEHAIRVIDLRRMGLTARLAADAGNQKAICYLERVAAGAKETQSSTK